MRRNRSALALVASATALLALTACSGSATGDAAEFSLRSNDWNPPAHPFNAGGWEPFADAIAEATDGRVTIENYPSEGLGAVADTLTLLDSGAADLASTVVAYHPTELPLAQITAAQSWDDAALSAQAMWEMCQQDPFKSEFLAAGIVPIMCTSVSPYELLTADKEITTIPGAFENSRLRATGLQGKIVEALGGTPTSDSSTEIYLRMEQGSIDGTTAGWYTLPALSLDEVTSNATLGLDSWNAGMVVFGVSTALWEEFPEDVKESFRELGRQYSYEVATAVDAQDAQAQADAEGEIAVYEVSDSEREEVRGVVSTVVANWVSEMESTLGLGDQAQEAADLLASLQDIESLPYEQWTPSTY